MSDRSGGATDASPAAENCLIAELLHLTVCGTRWGGHRRELRKHISFCLHRRLLGLLGFHLKPFVFRQHPLLQERVNIWRRDDGEKALGRWGGYSGDQERRRHRHSGPDGAVLHKL